MRARRAFTLIEVLLAATLAATIGLAVSQIVGTMHHAELKVRAREARRAALSAIERRVQQDLRSLVPPGGLYASGIAGQTADRTGADEDLVPEALQGAVVPTVEGAEPAPIDGRDTFTLAVNPPAVAWGDAAAPGTGAMWSVVWAIDGDPATPERGLVRKVTRVRDPVAGSLPEPVEVVAPNAVGMRVRYWDGTAWQAVWDSGASNTLPRAVEVTVVLAGADALEQIATLVAPITARGASTADAAAAEAAAGTGTSTGASGSTGGMK